MLSIRKHSFTKKTTATVESVIFLGGMAPRSLHYSAVNKMSERKTKRFLSWRDPTALFAESVREPRPKQPAQASLTAEGFVLLVAFSNFLRSTPPKYSAVGSGNRQPDFLSPSAPRDAPCRQQATPPKQLVFDVRDPSETLHRSPRTSAPREWTWRHAPPPNAWCKGTSCRCTVPTIGRALSSNF